VTAVLHAAVTALTRASRDRPVSDHDQPGHQPNDIRDSRHTGQHARVDGDEEDRS
jgi:hypothetical protein